MVAFGKSSDSAWAHDNLDVALAMFSTSAAYVFRTDGTVVYAVSHSSNLLLASDTAVTAAIRPGLVDTEFKVVRDELDRAVPSPVSA